MSDRELRDHVGEVLRRVEAGERLRVTADGRPVALLVPLPPRRAALSVAELVVWRAGGGGADSGLVDDLAEVLTDTTDNVWGAGHTGPTGPTMTGCPTSP